MPVIEKVIKRRCEFKSGKYKCDRELYDNKYCIFHSRDTEGKKDKFIEAFWEEKESQRINNKLIFTGFIFPRGSYLKRVNLHKADLRGTDLQKADLRYANLREADLRGAYLQKANLQDSDLWKADLRGINLQDANLWDASLQGANLHGVNLKKFNLQRVDLQGANLKRADLFESDLQDADLNEADLRHANLREANLRGVNLRGANLKRTGLSYSSFDVTNCRGVKFNSSTRCQGINFNQAIGSPLFNRFLKDEEYLEDFRLSHKVIYYLWYIFANCGRSFLRWALWSVLFAFIFAAVFFKMGAEAFTIQGELPYSFITMLYYSVVTFTTLGFGDIIPNTTAASLLVMLEVIMGYLMLGGLISILANKLARRS